MVDLGGGRTRAEDKIDKSVGFCSHVRIGTAIKNGEALGVVSCRNADQAGSVLEKLRSAFTISNTVPVVRPKLIHTVIGQ